MSDAFSRSIKFIFLTAGVYLLIVNIILWANSAEVNANLIYGREFLIGGDNWWDVLNSFNKWHDYNMVHYRGFEWFYDRFSTFPGLSATTNVITNYANILRGFSITNNFFLDVLIAIGKMLTTPILLVVTLATDIMSILWWMFSFLDIFNL